MGQKDSASQGATKSRDCYIGPAMSELDEEKSHDDGDLTDMLGELRVLLPSAQLLSAFLTTVPFAAGFRGIVRGEKVVFLTTFLLVVASLILLSAPAVQHRLLRPLADRGAFKRRANRQIVCGAGTLSLSLVLATQFVLAEVVGHTVGTLAAIVIAVLVLALWWIYPARLKRRGGV